jgi:putative addiction module component (TIGR02574 family)
MALEIPLEAMSVAEKVQLMERVWQSLSSRPEDVSSPEWHRDVLEERRRRLADGRATVSPWEDAKVRLSRLSR